MDTKDNQVPLDGPAVVQSIMGHFERRFLAGGRRRRCTFSDGIYQLGPRPEKGSGKRYVLPADYKEGDEVWIRIKEFENLGYANGWGKEPPAIVKECEQQAHQLNSITVRNCVTKYTCETCGYFYHIDSGD